MNEEKVLRQLYERSVSTSCFYSKETDNPKVDIDTFRLLQHFQLPKTESLIYHKKAEFYIQREDFWSCFSARRPHIVEIKDTSLKVSDEYGNLRIFIDFSLSAVILSNNGSHLTFYANGSHFSFILEPLHSDKKAICQEWSLFISKIIKQTPGQSQGYMYLARTTSDFYKWEAISCEDFEEYANSGDLLLLKAEESNNFMPKSSDTHVGIIIRNRHNQLYILQSTSKKGPGLTPWKDILKEKLFQAYNRLLWKQLKAPKDQKRNAVIEKFLIETLGFDNKQNLRQIPAFNSYFQQSQDEENPKNYQSWELIIRLYVNMGLIKPQNLLSGAKCKKALNNLEQGVSFGAQKIISFDSEQIF